MIITIAVTIFISVLSGIIDGAVEVYSLNRKLFEILYNKDTYGYWGSKSWLRAYKDGDKTKGYKNLYTRLLGAWDFYHNADDLRKASYLAQLVFAYYFLGSMHLVEIKPLLLIVPYILVFMLSGLSKRIIFNKLRKLIKLKKQ